MIRKVKRKFLALSMTALFVLLFVIIGSVNLINYRSVVMEADVVLNLLSENRGRFPGTEDPLLPEDMSAELPYESRYFSVEMNPSGTILRMDTSRVRAIDDIQAAALSRSALAMARHRGFVGHYRFVLHQSEGTIHLTFLDCGRALEAFRTFLWVSILIALAGYVLFFLVILICSRRIIRPMTESYEKQRQFITDAGHELKTPLTIIQADTDVLALELEDNEWLEDIRKQTRRLTELTGNLVFLSRMEEDGGEVPMIPFPFSDVVEETAGSFLALAQTTNKQVRCVIQPMLSLTGDENAIRRLVYILLDNAMKYSPEGANVDLRLRRQGRHILLTVTNTTCLPISQEGLERIFERFYRLDASRSSQTGGSGIGLSVAKAIVSAHGGKISALSDGENLELSVSFPTNPRPSRDSQ